MPLTSISLTNANIVPPFDPDLTAYTAVAYNSIVQTTVLATSDNAMDTITYSPTDADSGTAGHQINLTEGGDTAITITYTPDGGTAVTITITVSRHEFASTEIRDAVNGISNVTCALGTAAQTTPSSDGLALQLFPTSTWHGEEAIKRGHLKVGPSENAIWREWELLGRGRSDDEGALKTLERFWNTDLPKALKDLDCKPFLIDNPHNIARGSNDYINVTVGLGSTVHW